MKQLIFYLDSYQGNDTSLTVNMGQPDTDRMFFIMELGDDDKVNNIDCGYRSYEEAYGSALGRGADPLPPKPKKEPEESITVGNDPASLRRAIEALGCFVAVWGNDQTIAKLLKKPTEENIWRVRHEIEKRLAFTMIQAGTDYVTEAIGELGLEVKGKEDDESEEASA
jgi:hypothetical protein